MSPPARLARPAALIASALTLVALLAVGLDPSSAELIDKGSFRVAVDARIAPQTLPRKGQAPVRFSIRARISSTKGDIPPQLRRIRLEINRQGHLNPGGLPSCQISSIQPSTTAAALNACGRARVGEGYFAADVRFTEQTPFPSEGRLIAFNGRWHGKPAILAHLYGAKPAPTSVTIPFVIGKAPFGTTLTADLPRFSSKWGYLTELSMSLGRRFRQHGRTRSYLSAGCPAPDGINIVNFPLSRASFGFDDKRRVSQTLVRTCRTR